MILNEWSHAACMAITLPIAINYHCNRIDKNKQSIIIYAKNNHQLQPITINYLLLIAITNWLQQQFLKPMVAGAPCLVVITLPRIATAIAATFPEINAGFSHGNSIAE